MHFPNLSDMIGRTVEIDGEPNNANNGDVGIVVTVDEFHATVKFADGTSGRFLYGELNVY